MRWGNTCASPAAFTTLSTKSISIRAVPRTRKMPFNRTEEISGSNLQAGFEARNAFLRQTRKVDPAVAAVRCSGHWRCFLCAEPFCAEPSGASRTGSGAATNRYGGSGESGVPAQFRKTRRVAALRVTGGPVAAGNWSERRRRRVRQGVEGHGRRKNCRHSHARGEGREFGRGEEIVSHGFFSRVGSETYEGGDRGTGARRRAFGGRGRIVSSRRRHD